MNNRNRIFLITLSFAVVAFSLFMLSVVFGWFGPATDVGGAFCEAARPGLIKQPANTWSNLGFIFAGLLMAWQLSKGTFHKNQNRFTQSNFTAIFFSCIVVFLGPGSMAMHATETETGGSFDMLSMYLIASFSASYALQRFYHWTNRTFTISFVLIILICEAVGMYHEEIPIIDYAGNAIFAFFLTVTIVYEMLNSFIRKHVHERKYGFASVASLFLAFAIWNMWKDDSPLCDPHSLIQVHAIWHILDALAAYFLFRFYASEHKEHTN